MGHVGGMTQAGRVWVEEDPLVFGSFSGSGRSQTDLGLIADECFVAAEEAAGQVLNCIHPTLDSEEKRRDVIDYVQRLVKRHLGCEAFPYGSVPLKTYLPDGDIDLTAFKSLNGEESLPRDVLSILQAEQLNKFAEFEVKDSQFIDAEVKIVKCLVQNIVIDISFNQLGGLSTLCFLEQVDRVVGKNHLFKRSIILVKAWCYYESRILGAHHGLISTYALETLVLYIFNLFYSSLDGPLAVLYKFLEYFSQFDWENYCISLKGPVCTSSLPHIVVKMPEGGRYDLLLSEDFLETCMEMFSSSSRNLETTPKAFQPKHLNIIDPLKENNNLGRSVHRGNFYRIRSAFKYGARKLGQVLLQPKDKLAEEIREFFSNTLSRHGQKNNILIEHSSLVLDDEESLTVSDRSSELYSEDGILLKSSIGDFEDDNLGAGMEESETHSSTYGLPISGHCKAEHNTSYCTSSSNDSLGKHCHKSHSFSSKSSGENFSHSSGVHQKFELSSWLESRDMNNAYRWCMDDPEVFYNSNLENGPLKETDIFSTGGESDIPLNPLADLSGDYDCQIRNLLYGQLCNGVFSSARFSSAPPSPSMVRNDNLWDTVHQSMPLDQSQFYQTSTNLLFAVCCADSAFPVAAFGSEGAQKARGTGTYFPITIGSSRERSVHGRGKYKPQGSRNQYQRHSRSSGYQSNFSESSVKEFHPASSKFQGRGKSDVCCQSPRLGKDDNEANCSENALCQIEFGSLGRLGEDVVSGLSCAWDSTLSISIDAKKQERVTEESLPLKNEDEFPPLCQ